MKVHNLSIDSNQRDTTAYPNANNYVITLENPIYHVEEIRLVSAQIPTNFTGIGGVRPNSLVLRLTSGSDEFNQSVYVGKPKDSSQKGTPHYTGHLLLNGSNLLSFRGSDDPVVYRFHSGPQKIIKDLRIEFLYINPSGVLTPYPFVNQAHILKFEIKCSTNKLENLNVDQPEEAEEAEEAEPYISIPEISDVYEWKNEYTYILAILLFGLVLMMLMKGKPKPISG
jgi:hypothetical protein